MKNHIKSKKALLLIACAVALASYQNASALLTGTLTSGTSTYTSASPDPTVDNLTTSGFTPGGGAVFNMVSGTLTASVDTGAFWGQTTNASIDMTGGNFTFTDNMAPNGHTGPVVFGNNHAVFTANVSAGVFTIDSSTGPTSGLLTSRQGATANFSLSGTGELIANVTTLQLGTNQAGTGGNAGGPTTFSLTGSSLFEVTSLADFTSTSLAFLNGSTINFASGSLAEFSLSDLAGAASQSEFNTLINAGDITINGAAATTSEFDYTTSGGQGIISLAGSEAVPEPSTYLMMGLGFLGLLAVRRFRHAKV